MTERQAKAATMDWFDRICAGLVTWCMTPPEGVHSFIHRLTLLDAIQVALNFAEAKGGKWDGSYRLTVGGIFGAIVSTLPALQAPITPTNTAYIGKLCGNIEVFLDTTMDDMEGLIDGSASAWLTIVQV